MTILNGYATLAEIKAELHITDTADDAIIEQCVETASRLIDDVCGRVFYQEAAQTRYYTADCSVVFVDDLVSVTTLATDLGGNRTYSEVWAAADFELEPANAALRSQPYTRIVPAPLSARALTTIRRGVKIVGTFGWPAVPQQVKRACRIQSARYVKRKDAIFGVVGSAEMGQQLIIPKLDPDVILLLQGMMRPGVYAV